MHTIERAGARVPPPLLAGERLEQPTFHRRYEAMPEGIWAELVGGIVRMPSPLFDDHGGDDSGLVVYPSIQGKKP